MYPTSFVSSYLFNPDVQDEEPFSTDGAFTILRISPPPRSRMVICDLGGGLPADVYDALGDAPFVRLVHGNCDLDGVVETRNAMDEIAAPAGQVLYASSAAHAFVMLARRGPPQTLATLGNRRFVVASPGCQFMLSLVAKAHGVDVTNIATIDSRELLELGDSGDSGVSLGNVANSINNDVLCLLVPVDKPIDRRNIQLIPYASKDLYTILSVKAPLVRMRAVVVGQGAAAVDLACAQDLLVIRDEPSRHRHIVASLVATCARLIEDPPDALTFSDVVSRNQYYAMHLPFHQVALDALSRAHRRIAKGLKGLKGIKGLKGLKARASRGVFEDFKTEPRPSPPLEIEPTRDIAAVPYGEPHPVVRRFRVDAVLEGVPLRKGDRVVLAHQTRSVENGNYYVNHAETHGLTPRGSGHAVIVSPPFVPFDEGTQVRDCTHGYKRGSAQSKESKESKESNESKESALQKDQQYPERVTEVEFKSSILPNLQIGDDVYVDTQGIGYVSGLNDTHTIVRITPPPNPKEALMLHPHAHCFPDFREDIMRLCESDKGPSGKSKPRGIWDRPCEADAECPFFNGNGSKRGGCMNSGYCEMPMGTKNTSYRTFSGKPFLSGSGRHVFLAEDW